MSNFLGSQGTVITVKVGSGTATPVGGIKQISGLGSGSLTIIDVSTLASTAKEKAPGLTDEGSVKLSGQYLDTDAGQVILDGARSTASVVSIDVTLSNGTKFDFNGIVKTFDKGTQVDAVWTLDCEIEVSGPITKTPHA